MPNGTKLRHKIGHIQRQLIRLLVATEELDTTQMSRRITPRPANNDYIYQAARRICEPVGRSNTIGRPVRWRLLPPLERIRRRGKSN